MNDPLAPASPPKMPSGATASREVTALSCHGRSVSTVNSIVWPSPPVWRPAAAAARRSALRRKWIGRRCLDDLDRHGRHAGRERARRQAGLLGPGADAAGVGEHRRDERAAVGVVAADLHRPHRARALGHRLLGLDLGERLEQRVGQEHADDVAGGARLRRHGVDDRALRGLDLDRRQAAVVVRQVRVQHRADRERRVGVRVVLDDVDAERAGARRCRRSRRGSRRRRGRR